MLKSTSKSTSKSETLEKLCVHCSDTEEDIFRFESFSNLETDKECHLFRFRQKGRCYCFCVADLYRWIYGSLDLGEEIQNDKNPKTQRAIKKPTLLRLKREYEAYVQKSGTKSQITDRERQDFVNGIDQFVSGFETIHHGLKIPKKKAIDMYLEDMKELLSEEEFKRQKKIAKIVSKEYHWT